MIDLEQELTEESEILEDVETIVELTPEEIEEIEREYWRTASYENEVVLLIREKYNYNAELAILRQRDTKPEEFEEYNAYCEACKEEIKEKIIAAGGNI